MAVEPRNCQEKEEGQATEPDRQPLYLFFYVDANETDPCRHHRPFKSAIDRSNGNRDRRSGHGSPWLGFSLFHYVATPPPPK
jgi:hypothetical protein